MPFACQILFPVDFSASAVALTPAVAALAKRLAVPVTLLRVMSPDVGPEGEAHARAKLAAFGQAELEDASRVVTPGHAAATIVQTASTMESPLIVMPTRGESAFRSLLLGSVTAAVLHDAECPVWTSAHCEDGGPLPLSYPSIVCAIDLGAATAGLLEGALQFAADFEAALHVVHSVPAVDPRFESSTAHRAHAFLKASAQDEYKRLRTTGPLAETLLPPLEIVEEETITAGILSAARLHDASLLVIGRGVMQGVLGRLRTNAHDVIRHAPCPVLSI